MLPLIPAFPKHLGGSSAAGQMLRSRSAVRENILELAVGDSGKTLILDLLADRLVDRLAVALGEGTWAPFIRWVDETRNARPDVPNLARLFTAVVPAVSQVLGRDGFDGLGLVLESLAFEARQARASIGVDTVDELDLLLADMVSRIQTVDPMTAEHCRAVSAWCARIANRLSLNRPESAFVARGGLIHDVGKSQTPLEILQAPRKLTDAEWTIMREHVVTGHDMVRDHPKLGDFGGIVRSHHERYDGRGYPDGLDRERIPIGVRIVTVADAFNAMIGRRVYRTPFSPDRAVSELKRNAGTQFDPNVVGALLDVLSIKGDTLPVRAESLC